MRAIGRAFDLPLVANMVEKGRTPVLTKAELESIGYRLAIFPVSALLAAVQAMAGVYCAPQGHGLHRRACPHAAVRFRRPVAPHGLPGRLGFRQEPRGLNAAREPPEEMHR